MAHRRPRVLLAVLAIAATAGCAGTIVEVDVGSSPDRSAGRAGRAEAGVAPPSSATWTGTVDHVTDGDTLWLVVEDPGPLDRRPGDEVRARLLRIDTPELGRDGQPAECLAEEARRYLADLLPEGASVTAVHDVEARDQYGRDLVHLWRDDGLWVNGAMLRHGYATVVTFPPNVAHDDEVRALEAAARDAGAGLWSAC